MEILSVEYFSGVGSQIAINIYGTLMLLLMYMVFKDEEGAFRRITQTVIIAFTILISYMWIQTLDLADAHEELKVRVYDWNEVLENDKYEIISRDGDIVKLLRYVE